MHRRSRRSTEDAAAAGPVPIAAGTPAIRSDPWYVSTFSKVLTGLLAWNGALWLIVGWLFWPVVPGGGWTILVVAVLLLAPLGLLVHSMAGNLYPGRLTRIWVFRPFWYGQLFLPLLAGVGLLGALGGLIVQSPHEIGRWALGLMAVLLAAAAVAGYLGARRLVVRPLEISSPALPPGLDGLRIVQLSDLHVGPHTSRRHLSRIGTAVREAEPDLIVLTGDQVDDFPRDVEPLAAAFGRLSAPLGVYAVAGNHDVYAGWAQVRAGMENVGWRVLVNEAVAVERNGSRFWLAGTGDPAGWGGPGGADPTVVPDVERTLAPIPPGAFTVVLAHNPALWPELAARGVDLTLSGHTHYGQVAIPRLEWSLASVFLEHAMGLYRQGGSVLYINPGTNFWGIPFRLGAPSEVTVVTLRSC